MKNRPRKPESSNGGGTDGKGQGQRSKRYPTVAIPKLPEFVKLRAPLRTVGLVMLDRQGRIRYANDTAARMLGFPREWLVNRSFVVFVAKSDIERFLSVLMNLARRSDHQIVELNLSVGNQAVPVEIALTSFVQTLEAETLPSDGSGRNETQFGPVGYQLEISDLTEVRKIQDRLGVALQQWRSFVGSAPDVIMTMDHSGKIAFTNKPLWGYSTTALLGASIFQIAPKSSHAPLRQCLNTAFNRGKDTGCEIQLIQGDRHAWFNLGFGAARNDDGLTTTTTTVLVRETTDNKKTERLARTSAEQMRNLAARVEAAREEERTHVAREIHDELGQALTVLKLDLAAIQRKLSTSDASTMEELDEIIRQIDHTIERVRTISSELRPSILDHFGLHAAIEWQASQVEKRTGIRVRIKSKSEETEIPAHVSIVAFRVVQEALTNVMRHANASNVTIAMKHTDHRLQISITDNGSGVSPERLEDPKSLGILGMKERIAHFGGRFRIASLVGKGTRLDIIIPLRKR